jgi:hypothetical protein
MTTDHLLRSAISLPDKTMKTILFITLMSFACFPASFGQDGDAVRDELGTAMEVEKAYESEDIESIQQICSNLHSQGTLIGILAKKPDSVWKETVSLAIVESPWPADRQVGKPTPPGGSTPLPYYQLAIELLGPVLKDEDLKFNDLGTYRKLSMLEERQKLAAKYREARKDDDEAGMDGERFRDGRRNQGDLGSPPGEDFTSFPGPDYTPSSSQEEDDQNRNGIPSSIVLFLALLIGVPAIVLALRKIRSITRRRS